MKFSCHSLIPGENACDCLIVGIYQDGQLTPAADYVDRASKGAIKKVVQQGDITGKLKQTLILHHLSEIAPKRVLLVGCGKEKALTADNYQQIIQAAIAAIKDTQVNTIDCYLQELPIPGQDIYDNLRQTITAVKASLYTFDHYKSEKPPALSIKHCQLGIASKVDAFMADTAVKQAVAIAAGVNFSKNLANHPSNICTPTYLAEQAQQLVDKYPSISVDIIEEAGMQQMGMGALLAVTKASEQPAKLITIDYQGRTEKPNESPIILVGKGITFDSGGLSLKPADAMMDMKYDMCGAASILGTLRAIAELQLPLRVIGIIAAAENMVGSDATRPGDIVSSMAGKTIEILNTDAEGRLVLADALTYAKRFQPKTIIDVATLTGAAIVALGGYYCALYSNDDHLAKQLASCGRKSQDYCWPMPLAKAYHDELASDVADMANITKSRSAGSVVAACFLEKFIDGCSWAHLDVAGTAWTRSNKPTATGRPVPLLTHYLIQCAHNKADEQG